MTRHVETRRSANAIKRACPSPVPCAAGSTDEHPELGGVVVEPLDAHAADRLAPSSPATAISPGGDQLRAPLRARPAASRRLPDALLAGVVGRVDDPRRRSASTPAPPNSIVHHARAPARARAPPRACEIAPA